MISTNVIVLPDIMEKIARRKKTFAKYWANLAKMALVFQYMPHRPINVYATLVMKGEIVISTLMIVLPIHVRILTLIIRALMVLVYISVFVTKAGKDATVWIISTNVQKIHVKMEFALILKVLLTVAVFLAPMTLLASVAKTVIGKILVSRTTCSVRTVDIVYQRVMILHPTFVAIVLKTGKEKYVQ
jgi:hypothetical protein